MKKSKGTEKDRMQRRGDSGSPFVRVVVVLFFVFLFAVGASMYISQNVSYARVAARANVLADNQEAVLRDNEEAKNVQIKVGTDDYTEEMARNQLGMVKPGETIYDRDD